MSNNKYPIFKANLILRGKIECVTGLHIGGSKEKLEIGGLDSPVIREPHQRYPYIPGSSLKGKMRHLLEYVTGAVSDPISKLGDVSKAPEIVRIFGIGADEKEDTKEGQPLHNIGLTRLIVRDAHPDEYTCNDLWKNLDSDLEYTEYKPENTIDRLTAAANPRFVERVVAGSRFDFEMVYSVYQMSADDDLQKTQDDLTNILMGMRLMENAAIGKSGSRGYGKIRFHLEEPLWLYRSDYEEGSTNYKKTTESIAKDLDGLKSLADITTLEFNEQAHEV